MEFLRRLREQVGEIWKGMTLPQQVVLALVAALAVTLAVAAAYWSAQTEYRVLFSSLSPEDASALTARLTALTVPYRLSASGTSVSVPADRVAQLRVDLAAEGLPGKTGKGFELFDESQLGSTPFTQQVNYQRALQAELARTVMQVEPVAFARVLIARSEPSPFIREQKPTTASVVLRLKPNAALSRSTAAGIIALVSRAVEGLKPENVTLLDDQGHLLSEPQNPDAGLVSSQLDYRRSLEGYLATKAESMLTQLLGPGRAIVRVAADVNFQRLKERREIYSPDGKAITSEKTTNNRSTSVPAAGRGVTGANSNVAGRQLNSLPGSGGQSTNTSEETIQTDYAVSKTISETEDRLGSVDRLTVAALVDLSTEAGKSGLSLQDAQDIIKEAIGFKATRDQIKVTEVKLSSPVPPQDAVDAEIQRIHYWEQVALIARNSSLAVAAVALLLLGWVALRRAFPKPPPPPPPPPAEPEERRRLRERVTSAARRDPQAAASALALYLAREEGV